MIRLSPTSIPLVRDRLKTRRPGPGVTDYLYRWYDPLTGRWPSRDPIGEDGGMNLYVFLLNSPTSLIDVQGNRAVGPPPAKENWPKDVNPEVNEANQWHYTKISVNVFFCCCSDLKTELDSANEKLRTFSEFNASQNDAKIEVSADQKSAGFSPVDPTARSISPLAGLSAVAGVTLSGPGMDYAQQATTNSWHPLVGKRRWYAEGVEFFTCVSITISTEAYESMNNLAGLGGRDFRNQAKEMWVKYLNKVADGVGKNCPGRAQKTLPITETGPGGVPATKLPW